MVNLQERSAANLEGGEGVRLEGHKGGERRVPGEKLRAVGFVGSVGF